MKFKSIFIVFSSLVLCSLCIISCKNDQKQASKSSKTVSESIKNEGKRYRIDTDKSSIEWKGFKIFKSTTTSKIGKINFKDGELTTEKGQLASGRFVADMSSIQDTFNNETNESKLKLINHLKSADFFDVKKYPTAIFEITSITPFQNEDYNTLLTGNLTIKNQTHPFTIKTNVSITDEAVTISSEESTFDRKNYDIQFQSPIENGVIKNDIAVQIFIKARPVKN